jgi:hypothetical protein
VGAEPVPSLSVLCFRSYSGGSGERLAAFIVRQEEVDEDEAAVDEDEEAVDEDEEAVDEDEEDVDEDEEVVDEDEDEEDVDEDEDEDEDEGDKLPEGAHRRADPGSSRESRRRCGV